MTARCACGTDSGVIDSRHRKDGVIRRRRVCPSCGTRWTTIEVTVDDEVGLNEMITVTTPARAAILFDTIKTAAELIQKSSGEILELAAEQR